MMSLKHRREEKLKEIEEALKSGKNVVAVVNLNLFPWIPYKGEGKVKIEKISDDAKTIFLKREEGKALHERKTSVFLKNLKTYSIE